MLIGACCPSLFCVVKMICMLREISSSRRGNIARRFQCMGYWPMVRPRKLVIGQVLFCVFMDRDGVLRCVGFCFYIFFIYMWSRLDHFWSNVYQQDHRSGCVLKNYSRVHKLANKERGQYPAILTEQTWSIKDLLYGFRANFSCGMRWVVLSGQEAPSRLARSGNHSQRRTCDKTKKSCLVWTETWKTQALFDIFGLISQLFCARFAKKLWNLPPAEQLRSSRYAVALFQPESSRYSKIVTDLRYFLLL